MFVQRPPRPGRRESDRQGGGFVLVIAEGICTAVAMTRDLNYYISMYTGLNYYISMYTGQILILYFACYVQLERSVVQVIWFDSVPGTCVQCPGLQGRMGVCASPHFESTLS